MRPPSTSPAPMPDATFTYTTSRRPRAAPNATSASAPRFASLSTTTLTPRRRSSSAAGCRPTQSARITDEPTVPVRALIGPGRPAPAPRTRSGASPASSRTSRASSAAASSEPAAAASTSSSIVRSASTVRERSAAATRRCRWPKSMPSAPPADASRRSSTGGRPRPAGSDAAASCSTTTPRATRSPTSAVIVVADSPVARARSARLSEPWRRSSSTTRRRLASRIGVLMARPDAICHRHLTNSADKRKQYLRRVARTGCGVVGREACELSMGPILHPGWWRSPRKDCGRGPQGGETAMLRLRGAHLRVPRTIAAAGLAALAVGVTAPTVAPADTQVLPYQDASRPISERVADLMSRMTLQEKIGQMTQAERGAVADDPGRVKDWMLGSLLSGGGSVPTPNTAQAWADMVDQFQQQALNTRLHIPIIYGVDSVHGHGNLWGATVFPHNIGLGATRDPSLVEQVEHITAEETRASGPQWAFAPCICAARDDRWGRTYESFSENPKLVMQMETAIDGFQGAPGHLADNDRVLATAKHFAGDGDTEYGSSTGDYKLDQGVDVTNFSDFWKIDLQQYLPAVQWHKVGSVMPSFSSVDWTEDGEGNPIKMHANKTLITDVLKHGFGFKGFVITDWEGIHQIPAPNYNGQVRIGVNAGSDM